MNALRRLLYRFGSLLGDINAVRRGPEAVVARLVRKAILKRVGMLLK